MEVRTVQTSISVNEEEGLEVGSVEEAGDCLEKARRPREGQAQMGLVDSNFMGTPATHLWVEGFQKSKFVLFVFLSFLVRPRPDYCSEQRSVGCDPG